jgi:CDP-diacylglycerol---glycerol-3-phosphate 3-phosphatidyltransferase
MDPLSTEKTQSKKHTITDYLRANTAFLFEPIINFLARYRLSPDILTVAGTLSHVLFAWLIAAGHIRPAGLAVLILAPLDALDGALARKLGRKQGGFGAFLDSTLDRLAEIILFAGYIFYYGRQGNELLVATAYIALTGSLMVSYARSRAETLGFSCKIGIMSRVERYIVIIVSLLLNLPAYGLIVLALFTWITVAQRMFYVWQQWSQSVQGK